MTHAFAGRSSNTSDVSHHWFTHMLLNVFGGLFLGTATDFTHHNNTLGRCVCLERFQAINEIQAVDRITANTNPEDPVVFNLYDGIDTDKGYSMDCSTAPCTPSQMVNADAADWTDLLQSLPAGRGVISSPAANTLQISVIWNDTAGEANCLFDEPAGTDQSCYTVTITP